jgi:hypothetical protein
MRGDQGVVLCYPEGFHNGEYPRKGLFYFGSTETAESLANQGVFSDPTSMIHCRSAGALGKIEPCLCHGEQASFLIEPAAGFRELDAGRRQPSVLLVLTHGARPERINLHY